MSGSMILRNDLYGIESMCLREKLIVIVCYVQYFTIGQPANNCFENKSLTLLKPKSLIFHVNSIHSGNFSWLAIGSKLEQAQSITSTITLGIFVCLGISHNM